MPTISIVAASYNYGNYITQTIDSIISQSFSDWELIVVDDGSKDNSVEIIKSYCQKDSRIKLFQHENGINKGHAKTLELGIKNASGDWIALIDVDDILKANALKERIEFIQNEKNVIFLFNDVSIFGEKESVNKASKYLIKTRKKIDNTTGKLQKLKNGIYISNDNFFNFFSKINIIPTFSGVMIKRSVFEDIDFNSPLNYKFDRYLYTQIAIKYGVHFLDKKLTNWRMHGDSQTHTREDPKERLMFDIAIIKILAQQKLSFWDKIKIARCYLKYIRHTFIRTRGLKITYFMGKKL